MYTAISPLLEEYGLLILVIGTLILLTILGAIAFRRNYIIQIKVALLMDNESAVYNKEGFIQYIKKHKKALISSSLVVMKIENLAHLYTYYKDKNLLLYSICTALIKQLNVKETIGRMDFDKIVLFLNTKNKDEIKARLAKMDTVLNNLEIDNYGKYNFKTYYAIKSEHDKDYKKSVDLTGLSLLYSTIRESNLCYYCDAVSKMEEKLNNMNYLKQNALDTGKFAPFIQPKVSLKTGRIVGGELLVRWVDENLVPIYYPDEFIPLFEDNGFITMIDICMFDQLCNCLSSLNQRGKKEIVISSNFSKLNFLKPDFFEKIQQVLVKYPISTKNIEIEITESAVMENFSMVSQTIMKLKSLGFKIAMDDFGKEYSSLSSLVDNPFDVIKIDRMFTMNNLSIERERVIVENIIDLLSSLNVEIVVEGVETQSTIDELAKINLDLILQGYFFSKPIPLSKFETMLNTTYDFNYPEIIKTNSNVKSENDLKIVSPASGSPIVINNTNPQNKVEIDSIRQQMDEMRKMYEQSVHTQMERDKNIEIQNLKNQLEEAKKAGNPYSNPYFQGYDPRPSYRGDRDTSQDQEIQTLRNELRDLREKKPDASPVNVEELISKMSTIGNSKIDSFIEESTKKNEELRRELENERKNLDRERKDFERERKEREELDAILNEISREKVEPEETTGISNAEMIREQIEANKHVDLNMGSLVDDDDDDEDEDEDDNDDTLLDIKKPTLTLEEVEAIVNSYKQKYSEEWNVKAKEELKDGYYEVIDGLKYYRGRVKKNLGERLRDMSNEQKVLYNIIKNEIMQYDDLKNRLNNKITNSFDSFYVDKKQVVKLSLTKKRIRIYLALDTSLYATNQFPHKDVSNKKVHGKTPFYTMVRSKLSVKRIKLLVADVMTENNIKINLAYKPVDYANMFKYYKKKSK